MAATTMTTPYELLGAKPSFSELQIRLAYRDRIRELKEDRLNSSPDNR